MNSLIVLSLSSNFLVQAYLGSCAYPSYLCETSSSFNSLLFVLLLLLSLLLLEDEAVDVVVVVMGVGCLGRGPPARFSSSFFFSFEFFSLQSFDAGAEKSRIKRGCWDQGEVMDSSS